MDLSYDDVAQILRIIDASSIDELHIEMNGLVLTVRRNGVAPVPPLTHVTRASAQQAAPQAPAPAPKIVQAVEDGIRVSAPMLGTFYRSPAPGAPPFVEAGAVVQAGAPLCIIEVMKLLNTISAEEPARVREILVPDGTMVEYGQVLMVLETL